MYLGVICGTDTINATLLAESLSESTQKPELLRWFTGTYLDRVNQLGVVTSYVLPVLFEFVGVHFLEFGREAVEVCFHNTQKEPAPGSQRDLADGLTAGDTGTTNTSAAAAVVSVIVAGSDSCHVSNVHVLRVFIGWSFFPIKFAIHRVDNTSAVRGDVNVPRDRV